MALTPGTRIGPYEIMEPVGAGGMGEVFRARDTHLGRPAAIKVLPSSLARDAERLARFEREAQTLAALNHPNIAQVFGFEKGADDFRAIAMEFVEGPTLGERIAHGPIPVEDAIAIGLQIAEALESAHNLGIVHRDLKPGNIKIRPDGAVKVLDFGLAKATHPAGDSSLGALTNSPTITTPAMTQAGVILGTAAYMSPEQAKGRAVDQRADIWAFGCVLFEMLTGKRAFAGSDVSDVFVSILRDQPDWSALPSATPAPVRALLQRCLEKDVRRRLPHIGVARLDLSEPASAPGALPERRSRALLPWIGGATVVAAVALAAISWPRPAPVPEPPVRLRIELGATGVTSLVSTIAISPDGGALAFIARPTDDEAVRATLYVRHLDRLDAQVLPGTEGAQVPFFSPDGQWIAFFADGRLKKISSGGGRVITIADAPGQRGGWWADDDTITFATAGGMSRVASSGGNAAEIVHVAAGGPTPSWPQSLPHGRGVVYAEAMTGDPSTGTIIVRDSSGAAKTLLESGRFPRYVASGHLTFLRSGTMFAAPFDLDTLSLKGAAVPVVEGIAQTPIGGLAIAAVSSTGVLAYQPGTGSDTRVSPVMWLSRAGAMTPLRATLATWAFPRFSPDGRRLALALHDGRQTDIWVYDWERDILTRVTTDPASDLGAVWTPDGTSIVFGSSRGSTAANLYVQRADGTGTAQRLTESAASQIPDSFDPKGQRLVYHEGDPSTTRQSLVMLPIEGDSISGWKGGTPSVLIGGNFLKANARISPDGKWMAYAANDTGTFEIYVQPFPGPGERVQVSNGGGNLAMWAPVKSELYYVGPGQGRMMVVPYTVNGTVFRPARALPWAETRFSAQPPLSLYGPGLDLHPDGERFAVAQAISEPTARPGQPVLFFNFFDELRRLAPTR